MIVEFVGINGAGKTTVARAVAQAIDLPLHENTTARPRGSAARWLSRAVDLAAVPGLGFRCTARIRGGESAIVLSRLCRYERARRSLQSGLFEEGPIQGLSIVAARDPGAVYLASYVTSPDLVVHVNTPPEVALQRIRKRDLVIDLDNMTDEHALRVLSSRAAALENVLNGVGYETLRVHGNAPVADQAQEAAQAITRKL